MYIEKYDINNCIIDFNKAENAIMPNGRKVVEGIFSVIPPEQYLPAWKGPKRPVTFATSKNNCVIFRNGLMQFLVSKLNGTVDIKFAPELYECNKNLILGGNETSIDELTEWCEGFYNESSYTPRDYQLQAACSVINKRKSISEICTRAGKTLITHIIFSYIIDYRKNVLGKSTKCLMIVPSKLLSEQGCSDFKSYNPDTKCCSIQSDKRWSSSKQEYKDKDALLKTIIDENDILITTYQTWTKYSDKLSKLFDVCFCDECHNCSSASYMNIFKGLRPDCMLFGMTGSLPDNIISYLTICGAINYRTHSIQSIDLQEEGFLCDLNVNIYSCKYGINNIESDDYKYIEDAIQIGSELLMWKDNKGVMHLPAYLVPLMNQPNRLDLYRTICEHINITKKESGNAALLLRYENMLARKINKKNYLIYNIIDNIIKNNSNATVLTLSIHVDYTVELYNEIQKRFPNVRVWRISGDVKSKSRNEMLQIVNSKKRTDNIVDIIVGSYGTMSTGVTIPYLNDVILTEGWKSSIVNIQSIGRALGRYEGKTEATIHDIVDEFPTKLLSKHLNYRVAIYENMKNKITYVPDNDPKVIPINKMK